MEIIIICTAIVVFMPLLAKIPVGIEMNKLNGYDNKLPRLQQEKLTDFGARAMAAHKNCFEAIAYYGTTVVLVIAFDAHTLYTVYLCVGFVVLRLLYLVCYWLNIHLLRSACWILSMITIGAHYYFLMA